MESNVKPIGIVSATSQEPSDENSFFFILTKNEGNLDRAVIGMGDLVKVERKLPGKQENDVIYAAVESVRHFTDAPEHVANFVSYNFGYIEDDSDQFSRLGFTLVSAKVIFNEGDVYFPVNNGDKVFLCDKEEEVLKVLYLKYEPGDEKNINIGKHIMYKGDPRELEIPIILHSDYIVGPMNAHINISGMSGGAAKTTKALSIAKCLHDKLPEVTVVLFNTKNDDLLNVNHPANELDFHQQLEDSNCVHKKATEWYNNVKYIYPYQGGKSQKGTFIIDYQELKRRNNLDMLVAGDPDESGTMDNCTRYVNEETNITDWSSFSSNVDKTENNSKQPSSFGISPQSWNKYKRIIKKLFPDNDPKGIFSQKINGTNDLALLLDQKLEEKGSVIVIDLAPLEMLQQAFVFGCAIRIVKEKVKQLKSKKVVIFVDELNKYASEGTPLSSPILEALIDISETGRSSGICLMTAEQSLSVIHPRIKNNFATQIIGRTGPLELSSYDFSAIPQEVRRRITTFKQEDALVISPTINAGFLQGIFPDKFYQES